MIHLQHIRKLYQTSDVETVALDNISLRINQGDFVAIMGPSGCGKSTFLNILGMLDNPTSGKYIFDGKDISNASEATLLEIRKVKLGFIFQSFNLIDELTVEENLELGLIYNHVGRQDRKARVRTMMERVGISHRGRHFPHQLSGGQQQRVAIGRALVGNPLLVLADEPTGNLDSAHGHEVMSMLRELNNAGTSIVMVTHSGEHAQWAKRTIQLLDGRVAGNDGEATDA
ncbi:MAG: ABC transporter ATP-binding protein [Myxococcales bacterium]|nr:ABC transporter ATP-binding protein [Myxococcales bacterium]